jgi:ribosomal protein S18 acetylase RimI-like enzyme
LNERVHIRPVEPRHERELQPLFRRIESFTPDEVECAVEVFTRAAESGNTEYVGLVAEVEGKVVGVLAYGQTPMTAGTYDLYWIASDPELQRRGIGAALVRAMEEDLHRRGARLVRIETSGTPIYDPTRAFYERFGYAETARLRDFYKPGDDLVIFTKRL